MSKAHSRGRLEKNSHHNIVYNRNSTVVEEKRPSVFDRLGTRRDNASSSSSHYQPPSESPHLHRNEPLKAHSHRSGHSASRRGQDGSGHGRSRSLSPRMKKKPLTPTSASGAHRSSKVKSSTKSKSEKERQSRKSSPRRKSKSKASKSPKSKSNMKSKKSISSKAKGKIRSSSLSSDESSSKASSSSYSTRSRSRSSSSSATHASSSSSSAVTSSTDSSVPSIKLKPPKKDKNKKKAKKKSKVSGSVEKLKHVAPSLKRQSLSSSASSKDSRMESSHYKDMKRSSKSSVILNRHNKTPDRDSNIRSNMVGGGGSSSDVKRNFSKPMDREKDPRTMTPDRGYEHMSRPKERLPFDDEPRKRRLSEDNFGGSSDGNYKRSRTVPSPPPKYIKNNITPPLTRRVPPPEPPSSNMGSQKFLPRRDRSPPPNSRERERIRLVRSPPRRPSFDEHHSRRMESPRRDRVVDRPHGGGNYDNGNKMKPLSRDRPFSSSSSQHGGSSSNAYDKIGYPPPPRAQSRPRDRFAPARPLPEMERGGRIAPKHSDLDRDRGPPPMLKDRPKEYDAPPMRQGRPPLLAPPMGNMMGSKPVLLNKPQNPRMVHEDPRSRQVHIAPPINRHMPMIVKTKEALMERYEEQTIKQSRVDMWVDQTLKGNSCISEPFEPSDKLLQPKMGLLGKIVDETRTPTPEEIKDKCSSIGSLSGVNAIEPTLTIQTATNNNAASSGKLAASEKQLDTGKNLILDAVEDLSDFSDDDDDILTREVPVVDEPEQQHVNSLNTDTDIIAAKEQDSFIDEGIPRVELGVLPPAHLNATPSSISNSSNFIVDGDKKQTTNDENTSGVGVDLDKESARTVVTTTTSSLPIRMSYDLRDARSLHSQSQTDDDILERMDFEEISDEDFGEVENKISIVDVLGINWASLLRKDKCEQLLQSSGSVSQRWTSSKVFQHVGLSRKHCGKMLFQQVVDKVKETLKQTEDIEQIELEKFEKELEMPIQRLRSVERKNLFTNYGLGNNSRAFSARRDMVVRRYLLNLPAKSVLSVDFGNQVSTPIANSPQGDVDCTELLKLSVSLFKSF